MFGIVLFFIVGAGYWCVARSSFLEAVTVATSVLMVWYVLVLFFELYGVVFGRDSMTTWDDVPDKRQESRAGTFCRLTCLIGAAAGLWFFSLEGWVAGFFATVLFSAWVWTLWRQSQDWKNRSIAFGRSGTPSY